jgi:hypothetical protein
MIPSFVALSQMEELVQNNLETKIRRCHKYNKLRSIHHTSATD